MEVIDWLIEFFSKPSGWIILGLGLVQVYNNKKKEWEIEYKETNEFREDLGLQPLSREEWWDSEREDSGSNTKDKKPLNQIQKICILVVVACFWLWAGFGDGFRPQYSVVAFAIGITSIVAFFLFKDR